MKTILLATVAALALASCASPNTGAVLKQIGENLQGCERDYQGAVGLTGNLSFNIRCAPIVPPPTAVPR